MTENKKETENFKGRKYLIITHTFATGPTQELRDFFIKNNITFSFLEHPFSFNDKESRSKITYYQKGIAKKNAQSIKIGGHDLLFFAKDFFYTLYFVIKFRKKYDICIAADNLNTLAAWFLKKIGYINKLVYWTIDYTPRRFENTILNKIYHSIDRFCCYHADLLWNSSKRMFEARNKNGVNIKKCAKEIIVPDGCHFEEIGRLDKKSDDRFKLVFMGHLIKNKGVDLIIQALPKLIEIFPEIKLTIIGKGNESENLKALSRNLNIEKYVNFTGFIEDHKEVERIIASCGIAIAPYVPDPGSFTFFSDVGKVKIYLAAGLPVLVTDVPEIAKEIEEKKAGMIFQYDPNDLIEKISEIIKNEEQYDIYRENSINLAKNLDWNNLFSNVLEKTLIIN